MAPFLLKYENLKMEIFAKLFVNAYPDGIIPDELKMQAQARGEDGGFNLNNSSKITHAAYVASVVESSETVRGCFPTYNPDQHPAFSDSIEEIKTWTPAGEEVEDLHLGKLLIMLEQRLNNQSLQGQLTNNWHKKEVSTLKELFQDETKKLAWFMSISGDANAGRWLRARPKCDAFRFSNKHFSAMVCYRLYHRQPSFIEGSRCNCKRNPLLDERGHHISTGCGREGYRIMTHDAVKSCIKDMFNCSGVKTREEVAQCFREANPDDNKRPDLLFYNVEGYSKKVVGDVAVTCPVPVSANTNLTLNQARKVGRAAELSRHNKENKYDGTCNNNGFEFKSLIFESTGRIDKPCDEFLRKVLKQKGRQENDPSHKAHSNYWLSRLNCTLQKAIATSIVNRSRLINCDMVYNPNYQFDDFFIQEHEFRH
jgi:hypothetical protein